MKRLAFTFVILPSLTVYPAAQSPLTQRSASTPNASALTAARANAEITAMLRAAQPQ